MNYKILRNAYVLLLLTTIQVFGHGFIGSTLIKTPTGYTAIQYLKENDFVISYDYEGHCVPRRILQLHHFWGSEYITLKIENAILYVHPEHKFYDQKQDDWVEAQYLKEQDSVLLKNCIHEALVFFKSRESSVCAEEFEFYDITIDEYHNYCVTTEDILVHNPLPLIAGLVWTFGAGVEWFAGTALLGTAAYIGSRSNSDRGKEIKLTIEKDAPIANKMRAAAGSPDPNDDDYTYWRSEKKYKGTELEQIKKSEKSHRELVEEHIQKLEAYKANPDAYDNEGRLLKAAGNEVLRAKIIQGRINVLEQAIRRHTQEAAKLAAKAIEEHLVQV